MNKKENIQQNLCNLKKYTDEQLSGFDAFIKKHKSERTSETDRILDKMRKGIIFCLNDGLAVSTITRQINAFLSQNGDGRITTSILKSYINRYELMRKVESKKSKSVRPQNDKTVQTNKQTRTSQASNNGTFPIGMGRKHDSTFRQNQENM